MRRIWTIAGILVLAAAGGAASWTWSQVPMQGKLNADDNAFFMTFHPELQKVLLTIDSGAGEVASYAFDPPRWTPIGTDAMAVPMTGSGYAYGLTQSLVFDLNLSMPLLFGMAVENAPGTSVLMMPYKGAPDGQWAWTSPSWKKMDPDDPGGFVTAYDSVRRRTVIMGLFFQGDLSRWTQEFDGHDYTRIAQPDGWNFTSGVAGFDPGTGRTVFFGKVRDNHGPETAEFDGNAWTLVETSQAPRKDGMMTPLVHVPALGGLVGAEQTSSGPVTWLYRGHDWRALGVQTPPPPRSGAQITYDETGGRLILFGGADEDGDPSPEVWELVQLPGHQRPVEKP